MQPLRDLERVEIFDGIPDFVRKNRARGAKRAGLKYEEQAQAKLSAAFAEAGLQYIQSPWFKYSRRSTPRMENFAQPDGLCPDPKRGVIFLIEIKLKHTAESYFQLLDKYVPLLEKYFNAEERLWRIAPVEVCRWYDPAVAYPTSVKFRDNILDCDPKDVSVHVCRP